MSNQPAPPSVLTEWRGPVLLVTLNRPQVSNALDPQMLAALAKAWDEAAMDDCRAVVVAAAGRNFCAGADLAAAGEHPDEMNLRRAFHPQYLALATLAKPVIAAVNGAAAGGGLGIALAADIRILADSARLVPAWVQIGLVPDLGASWYATRLLGEARTFDWFTSGEALNAERALALGLASEIVPLDRMVDHAVERAQRLAAQPGLAVAMTKMLLAEARRNGLADQLEAEIRFQKLAHAAPGRTEQVAARLASFARK